MKELAKRVSNALLRPLDLEIRRIERPRIDPERHMLLLEEAMGCYREFGLNQIPPRENRIRLMAELQGTQTGESIYLLEYLNRSLAIAGDVCEFGIAGGATSALLANEIRETPKWIWLFDSFQGLPKPTEKDVLIDDIHQVGSMAEYEGRMAFSMQEVRTRLDAINFPPERTMVVPGFIEKTIGQPNLPDTVCFAYVDFDFYEPIVIALRFLHEHMPVGGHIVVDDYGFFSEGAKTAVDEFTAEHSQDYESILPLEFAGHFIVLRKLS